MKTVQRFFTVSGVLIAVFCLLAAVTPLSFAVEQSMTIRNSSPYNLPIDTSFQYVTKYWYGSNSAIVDFKYQDNHWYRVIVNNNNVIVTVYKSGSNTLIGFSTINSQDYYSAIYWTDIGTSYSSNSSFKSLTWYYDYLDEGTTTSFYLSGSSPYVNSANTPVIVNDSVSVAHCDFNSYYPFSSGGSSSGSSSSVDITPILNNQSTIINKEDTIIAKENQILTEMSQNQYDNWRYFTALSREFKSNQSLASSIARSQESAANSRQSQIMDAGSDISVSTVDNWVNGNNGLAGKLTELAATLSSNAAIFSQNQVSNQENLSRAGTFVNGVFSELPTGIVAACVCFLIILICVKVVGR